MTKDAANYQVDARWRIVAADAEFCRLFRSTLSNVIGSDVRELLRADFRLDFRRYVARALVGVGEREATFPMITPRGHEYWVRHRIEPMTVDGLLSGFRGQLIARSIATSTSKKPWWQWRGAAPHVVWDAEVDQLAAGG